ncbi:hypothetical protein FHS76_001562 [Ochrobactrum daejeonense]|uniref:DUF6538 domain-containing protein n=1 Tax=Brucella daejeonensis TaxID=659015 RepID=A0A7W9EM44_9HYPH|nr:DUF6538 domain-containing protein [Brucella daejeonensis]MBB5701700.1 hypothetical protein [Brucella daejeonensis]
MAGRKRENDPDRFIVLRDGRYQYRRRVPTKLLHLDKRTPQIRISPKTSDLAKARALRDVYERADSELWAALIMDSPIRGRSTRKR